MRSRYSMIVLALCVVSAACESGRYSSRGFRLPSGNAERGKVAFVNRGCSQCHIVSGATLPAPNVQAPAVVVSLGGPVASAMTDAHLFTSIVHPSYRIALYPKEQVSDNGQSRMPSFAERMPVQEVSDIVEFLQQHYELMTYPNSR